jgi:two-component system NtrC family sensor kinase
MPNMDGFELISAAKQIQPDLAVLVMTGFGTVETAIQALKRGVDGLLLKPFNSGNELVETANQVLEENRRKLDARRLKILRPLFDVSQNLLAETDPEKLKELILGDILGLLQSSTAAIYTQSGQGELKLFSGQGKLPDLETDEKYNQALLDIFAKLQPVITGREGIGQIGLLKLFQSEKWGSAVLIPIQQKEKKWCFLAARDLEASPFTPSDIELFTILARQSMVALENARLYQDLLQNIKKVEDSQKALVQAEKMAAVGRLMASVAHEINNPLQSVRNCLHLASLPDLDSQQKDDYVDLAQNELNRLARVVQRMLEFYRPGKSDSESITITDILDRLMALLKPQMDERTIKVELHMPKKVKKIKVVRDQIQQVLFNLMINAMDALEPMPKLNRKIWIDIEETATAMKIYVEDTGPGISEQLKEHIFEPFVSTKPTGTGLGLSVSYGIIESHGGLLKVAPPRKGTGACFEISLPFGA